MPRRMRSGIPYGFNAQRPTSPSSTQPINTDWRSTLGSYAQQYGPHLIPGLQALASGALEAYSAQKGMQQPPVNIPQPTGIQLQQPIQQVPQIPNIMQPEEEGSAAPQYNLSDILSHLISQRVDSMGSMIPTYPNRLYSNAFNASNSQMSQQGPPQYRPTGPQFAFDQTIGGGASYNPLASVGDFPMQQTQQKPWQNIIANQLGGLLSGLSPYAGMIGGTPGMLGGAALGGLGYGLQQF